MEERKNSDNASNSANQNGQTREKPAESNTTKRNTYKRPYYRNRRRYSKRGSNPPLGFQQINTNFKKLSIVVPIFNEEESLQPLANEIRKAIKPVNIAYEVIMVDDGSSDNSLKIVKEICKPDKRFKFISFRKNYGKSAALQIGFREASGDVVVTMDSDLQDDPHEIPNLLKKLEEGHDLVSGWKRKRHDPFIKKFSSRFFNFITRLMTGIRIHDFNCGLKAYKREVTNNINVYGELHRYMPVLAKWEGFNISEIIVKHHPRRYGKTKYGISRFFKGFIDLITVLFSTRYIKRPMHFFGFFGAFAFFVGIIVNGYLSYLWISGESLSNRPMLFLGILLIIVGVQFFSVGLLGEMLVHNSRSDKEYLIKDKG